MDIKEMSARAAKRELVPDGLCLSEIRLFEVLRILYDLFDNKKISALDAAREKRKAILEFEKDMAIRKIYSGFCDMRLNLAKTYKKIEPSCPLLKIIDGRSLSLNEEEFQDCVRCLNQNSEKLSMREDV